MPIRTCALVLGAAASLGLAGCERGADSGATANPNASGSPATGTARAPGEVQPFSTGRERSLHHSLQLPA